MPTRSDTALQNYVETVMNMETVHLNAITYTINDKWPFLCPEPAL